MKLETLADFKRALAMPNVTLTMTHFYDVPSGRLLQGRLINATRKVGKLQTNSVALQHEGKLSWLDFGKATQWVFKDNTVCKADKNAILVYRLDLNDDEAEVTP